MFAGRYRFGKIVVLAAVTAAVSAPAVYSATDGGLLTQASRQAVLSNAGLVTDGTLLTRAGRRATAVEALSARYDGMVTDGALLTAAAERLARSEPV